MACVPLGVSDYTTEPAMRPHTAGRGGRRDRHGRAVAGTVPWPPSAGGSSTPPTSTTCSPGGRFPTPTRYDGFPQHENGIGMARAFDAAFDGDDAAALGVRPGFFAWVDGAPAAGYRAPRTDAGRPDRARRRGGAAPVAILTGEYGAMVLGPLLADADRRRAVATTGDVRLLPVHNAFFGGNIAVTGLLTGVDIVPRPGATSPSGQRYLLPDVCLSEGRFLDGMTVAELPRPVEIVPDRRALLAPCPRGVPRTPTAHRRTPSRPVPVALGESR